MSDHPLTPKSNSKIVPPFIPKPKESLEAENARLKSEVERLIEGLNAQGTRLLALSFEVERLRKAGDEMVNRIRWFERPFKSVAKCPEIEAWQAAKEGKQS